MNAIGIPVPKHRYDSLCGDLRKLAAKFDKAVKKGRRLSLQRLWVDGGEDLTEQTWPAFVEANTAENSPDQQHWEVWPDQETLYRYYGADLERNRNHFGPLAEDGWGLLKAIESLPAKGLALPEGLALELPADRGRAGWVQLLYDTVLNGADLGWRGVTWDHTGQLDYQKQYVWGTGPGGIRIPLHPCCSELRDLFRSSAEAIRIWLDPKKGGPPVHLPPVGAARDGPVPPDQFRLGGQTNGPFSVLEMRLLKYLWRRDAVLFQHAMEYVYGHDADDKDVALRSLVKHVNAKLKNSPNAIHYKNGYLYLYIYRSEAVVASPSP
jgi:hypothetical protein